MLQQGDHVAVSALEDRPVGEVEGVQRGLFEPVHDGCGLGQEATAHAVAAGGQAQVQARWLDLRRSDVGIAAKVAVFDQGRDLLVDQDAVHGRAKPSGASEVRRGSFLGFLRLPRASQRATSQETAPRLRARTLACDCEPSAGASA